MKYLKKYKLFENSNLLFTQEEADDISDIFRDMTEEFDMIYYNNKDNDDEENSTINSYFCYRVNGNKKTAFVYYSKTTHIDANNLSNIFIEIFFPIQDFPDSRKPIKIDFDKVIQNKNNFIERLRNMGYYVLETFDYIDGDIKKGIDLINIAISKKKYL